MSTKIIKSVERGWGESSQFWSTDQRVDLRYRVDRIEEDTKQVSDHHRISVYQGFIEDQLIFEMGISNDVTVVFCR